MIIFVPYLALSVCFGLSFLINLFLPPAVTTGALVMAQKLIDSECLPLVILGKILLCAEKIDIMLFGFYLAAFKLCISMMPFAVIFLVWKLLTL